MTAAAQTEKVRLVHVATGAVHEAWPVDAKEHLAVGDYVREADYVAAPSAGGEGGGEVSPSSAAESSTEESSEASEAKPTRRKAQG